YTTLFRSDGRQRTAGICEQHRHHTREHLPGTASDRLHNEHHAWCSHLRRAQCNEHRILRDRGQSSLCARHHFVRHTVLHLHPCARTAAALVRLVIRRRPVDPAAPVCRAGGDG